MTAYEIPLSPKPQTFAISLVGVTYLMTLLWNPSLACWVLDIDDANGNPVVLGIPVVTGLDLLAQYSYLGVGGHLIAQTDGSGALGVTYDGNSSIPVVGPGDWVIVGSSLVGDGSQLWGPELAAAGGSASGSLTSANIFPNDVPTYANLGVSGRLYFVVTP